MGPRLEKGAIHADYLAFGTSSNHIEATNFSDNASSEMKLSLHLELLAQSDLDANGITFCTGALGVRADNDLIAMLRRFAPRIAFFHLRSTQREATLKNAIGGEMESFFEVEHLKGYADLTGIIIEIVKEERRRAALRYFTQIPFRADHGQKLLNERERGAAPAYPAIGRLRGFAELRGSLRMAEQLMMKVGQNEIL